MYKKYFPECPVEGPIEPAVEFGHLGLNGAVPKKCAECKNLFEGECTRYIEEVGHYLHLDHGFCGIAGPTDPVFYDDGTITSKVEIPRKCSDCVFLKVEKIKGFYCSKDEEIWGYFSRGLDWGNWKPNSIYISLPLPKFTTKKLILCAENNDLIEFIKEFRRINPGLSISEAREDFQYCRNILAKFKR